MELLNNDVWVHLICFLSFADLKRLSLTSRRLRDVTLPYLFAHLNLTGDEVSLSHARNSISLAALRQLQILSLLAQASADVEDITHLVGRCTRLQRLELHISSERSRLTSGRQLEVAKAVVSETANLRLSLHFAKIQLLPLDFSNIADRLDSLWLVDCGLLRVDDIREIARLRNLKRLGIKGYYLQHNTLGSKIWEDGPALERLHVEWCTKAQWARMFGGHLEEAWSDPEAYDAYCRAERNFALDIVEKCTGSLERLFLPASTKVVVSRPQRLPTMNLRHVQCATRSLTALLEDIHTNSLQEFTLNGCPFPEFIGDVNTASLLLEADLPALQRIRIQGICSTGWDHPVYTTFRNHCLERGVTVHVDATTRNGFLPLQTVHKRLSTYAQDLESLQLLLSPVTQEMTRPLHLQRLTKVELSVAGTDWRRAGCMSAQRDDPTQQVISLLESTVMPELVYLDMLLEEVASPTLFVALRRLVESDTVWPHLHTLNGHIRIHKRVVACLPEIELAYKSLIEVCSHRSIRGTLKLS